MTAHRSRFRMGPLTVDASGAQVQVLHLPAVGSVGRHPAASQQRRPGSPEVTDWDLSDDDGAGGERT